MKRIFLIIFSFAIPCSIFCLIYVNIPYRLKELQQTTIKFDQMILNLGDLKQREPHPGTFTFTNTGDTPLILNNVTTSCGCTTLEWSRQPIEPGKTGEIKVIYDALHTGRFIKTIRVEGNIPGGFTELTVKGQVLAKASNPTDYTP